MSNSKPVRDPETGIVYPSQRQFCKAAGLSLHTISERKRNKNIPPEMLNFPGFLNRVPARDHENRHFQTVKEMCVFWKIRPALYTARICRGWDVEKALTTPVMTQFIRPRKKEAS